jgi:hypothetical protein
MATDEKFDINRDRAELKQNQLQKQIDEAGSQNLCAGQMATPTDDPKMRLLSQLDYAEDRLIGELSMLRDARRLLNFASYETIRALDQFTRLEQTLKRY